MDLSDTFEIDKAEMREQVDGTQKRLELKPGKGVYVSSLGIKGSIA